MIPLLLVRPPDSRCEQARCQEICSTYRRLFNPILPSRRFAASTIVQRSPWRFTACRFLPSAYCLSYEHPLVLPQFRHL